mmetsp:Transcript_49326/g.73569  ORF Transcript_49326/g.73569 Transcript_49326/m.73569 type:complete len:83 (-) Transcript_49326:215-463(-)|eukprot:CAMPEP_0194026364 /NCGR_PEP_ID=MMETSP0009_2-20130614/692_1 /TAXON_ID=210454 /ORGANISM="Grammatophora oceanica, Strain CCMP 410" /LENGTH=82 /DNA_ID=CAMNT_0038665027 /DNA_START=148 /DNA_END=396 /DNA_ORIENTATION=-
MMLTKLFFIFVLIAVTTASTTSQSLRAAAESLRSNVKVLDDGLRLMVGLHKEGYMTENEPEKSRYNPLMDEHANRVANLEGM